jgi:NitT/TauT family transport system permease protein
MNESTTDSVVAHQPTRFGVSRRMRERLLAVGFVVLWLLFWEFSIRWGLLDARFFFPPTAIASTFVSMWLYDSLGVHVANSMQRLMIGYCLGVVPGLLLGRLIARSAWLRAGCGPLVVIWWSFPAMALFPVIMLIFGLGDPSKWNVVALSTFLLVVYRAWAGAAARPATVVDASSAGNPGRIDQHPLIGVESPQSLFADLKLATWAALVTLIPAEFVGAKSGIGFVIWISWQSFHPPQMYVGIALAGALGALAWLAVELAERLTLAVAARRGARGLGIPPLPPES